MPRKGENIYKRKDGRWEGRIKKQGMQNQSQYKSFYGRTYREVKEKMNTFKQTDNRRNTITCHITMVKAADIWMKSGKNKWKSGTYNAYRQIINKYVIPYMGNIEIEKINNQIMERFLFDVINREERQKLSNNYLFQICSVIRRILNYMNRVWGSTITIPVNPVSKEQTHQIILPGEKSLSVLEEYLYHHCEEDTCLGILIAFHTGIRLGELSGLMWRDIDMSEKVIYIRRNILRVKEHEAYNRNDYSVKGKKTRIIEQTPKTCESMRVIPIPPRLCPLLSAYKKDEACYIISGARSTWAEPRTIQYRFKKILKKCDIEYFNFHMLRHAFATRCVAMGLDIKSLSGILGHSNIQMTLNLYVHPTIQQKRLLMEKYNFSYTF